jgi:hypothetical protein
MTAVYIYEMKVDLDKVTPPSSSGTMRVIPIGVERAQRQSIDNKQNEKMKKLWFELGTSSI